MRCTSWSPVRIGLSPLVTRSPKDESAAVGHTSHVTFFQYPQHVTGSPKDESAAVDHTSHVTFFQQSTAERKKKFPASSLAPPATP